MKKKIALALSALAIVILLSITTIYGGGGKKMEPVDTKTKEINELAPKIYEVGASMSLSLFPVPQDNAVGTNDHADAITIISFPKGKLEMDNYFRKAVNDVRGSGIYLPVIGESLIGFGQMRRFLLYDFKDKAHAEYEIEISIEKSIEQIEIAEAARRRFIFEINEFDRHSESIEDSTYFLELFDLSGKEPNLLRKVEIGKGITWTVAYGRVFLWFFDTKKMIVSDLNLEPSRHPLADVINQNKNRVDFTWMVPHPFLPFAILAGAQKYETVISWDEGRAKTPQRLPSNGTQFSFSPDGKWVTFQKEDYVLDKKMTYIMPVSEKYPNYLGTPILLIDKYFHARSSTWTKNPVSFVTSDGDIYRWELTNEAHPESDKPTFHEYVVEKDLERLAKERKHGSGK